MNAIADYRGNSLNHVEALYRPGDRDLAIELAELLGCAVTDTGIESGNGSTFLAMHPNTADRDIDNNAFYVSEITAEHAAIEAILEQLGNENGVLQAAVAGYRDKARRWPFSIPHFGLRYRAEEEIEAIAQRLDSASERLRSRVSLRMFRPGDEDALTEFTQGFVHQDIIVAGSFLHGQLIELQYQPPVTPA